jgi:hypothetical protein
VSKGVVAFPLGGFSLRRQEKSYKRVEFVWPLHAKKVYQISGKKLSDLGTPFAVKFEEIFLPLKTH